MTLISQNLKVWNYLNTHKEGITSYEIIKLCNTCYPSCRIKNLRDMYGISTIADRWIVKKRKETDSAGKEKEVTIRYKQYFLSKFSD